MIISFDSCVDYGQIVVARSTSTAGMLWSDAHCAQGFAWLPTSVAFGVPDRDGLCRIEAHMGSDLAFDAKNALWAVRVPFEVSADGLATIGTVTDPRDVAIPPGRYSLTFAAYPGAALGADFAFRLLLLFRPDPDADFAIMKAGDELTTEVVLRRDAEPV